MAQTKQRPKFARSKEFGAAIKKIESDYFQEGNPEGRITTGDWRLWHKAVILIILFFTVFGMLVFTGFPDWVKILLCIVLGAITASIGFNVGHDANHGSFSYKTKINNPFRLSFNLFGIASFFWRQKHNVFHHTFTNLNGVDDDIAQNGLLRFHPDQPWKWIYKLQPYYCWLMYCLLYLGWVWVSDFIKYFSKRISGYKIKITKRDHLSFWATKVFHLAFFCIFPAMFVGFGQWLAGYLIYGFTVGFTTAIVFQLAHIVEKVSQPETLIISPDEWIAHEVDTTANFAMNNKVLSWFVGGLNFQIEHHLFPKVSHIHYPDLSKKVQATCEEYEVKYHYYETFWSALNSHRKLMIDLSKKPVNSLTESEK